MNGATKCVNITILEDNALEGNQTFTIALTTIDSGIIIGRAATTIIIMDNDGQT